MPVDLYCKEQNLTITIEVSTKPELYYNEALSKCTRLICNRRLSYFDPVTVRSVLHEAGPYGRGTE